MVKYWSNNVRCYLGAYDIGTATTSVVVTRELTALDPTSLGDSVERTLAGIYTDSIDWEGLFDDNASLDAALSAIAGSSSNNLFTVTYGTGTGSAAYAGTGILLTGKPVASMKELVRQEFFYKLDQEIKRCTVHFTKSTSTGITLSGTVDGGALSTAGGTMLAHVFTLNTGTITLIFEHAVTAAGVYTATGTLTFVGTGSQVSTFTGTMNRFSRVRLGTITGSPTATAVYAVVVNRS